MNKDSHGHSGQEVLSGGQRINDPVELEARMRKKGVDPNSPGLKEVRGT